MGAAFGIARLLRPLAFPGRGSSSCDLGTTTSSFGTSTTSPEQELWDRCYSYDERTCYRDLELSYLVKQALPVIRREKADVRDQLEKLPPLEVRAVPVSVREEVRDLAEFGLLKDTKDGLKKTNILTEYEQCGFAKARELRKQLEETSAPTTSAKSGGNAAKVDEGKNTALADLIDDVFKRHEKIVVAVRHRLVAREVYSLLAAAVRRRRLVCAAGQQAGGRWGR